MPTFLPEMDGSLSPTTCKAIAAQLQADVDEYCVNKFTDDYRHHLGMSVIGDDCWRKIWYMWRWAKKGIFDGRMLRLFNRGYREEERFIEWLEGIGCTVFSIDPQTGEQYKLSFIDGHFGGSNDAAVILPYIPDFKLLGEFKTHHEKNFTQLFNKGLMAAQPKHYTQMCNYGKHYGLKYGLYVAVNKNDDDLYFEIIPLDWNLANSSLVKAEQIIYATEPPQKISIQPNYYKCKNLCVFLDICHHGAPMEVNCRSCKNASPVANAEWFCSLYQQNIPKDFLPNGCPKHIPIA